MGLSSTKKKIISDLAQALLTGVRICCEMSPSKSCGKLHSRFP